MPHIKSIFLLKNQLAKKALFGLICLLQIIVPVISFSQTNNNNKGIKIIHFGKNNHIDYNLETGTYNVFFINKEMITDAYAACNAYKNYDSRNYTTRIYSTSKLNDANGIGIRHIITLSGNGQLQMQQVFYVYQNKEFFYTELKLLGKSADCNYMAPLISTKINIFENGDNRAIYMPFDNDAWSRYNGAEMRSANFTSSEATALFNNTNGHGLVVGSVEHNNWKSGVKINGGEAGVLSGLSVFAGFTDSMNTRDKIPHGRIPAGDTLCRSAKMLIGWFADWRDGLETYGKANRLAEPKYIFDWKAAAPIGWNSWGVLQDHITLEKAKGVVDFFADSCKTFRTADNTLYIDLDSYWDRLCVGGLSGDCSELIAFAKYCKQKGFKPGIYWAPFVDWGKQADRKVEGSNYLYKDCWAMANGKTHDFDGGRAMDPTHPATRKRIDYFTNKFKEWGFQMIKIDFLGHAAIEADSFYNKNIHTGMQAYRNGMEYLIDKLDGKMLVYAAISPNLATGRYVHTRRIACDAFKAIGETSYTLNSTTYGWWLNNIYNFNDADHVVFVNEKDGANRARFTASVITGSLITGDDYSSTGHWTTAAKTLLQNKDILAIAQQTKRFKPLNGNTSDRPDNYFICSTKNYNYLAVINYSDTTLKCNISLDKLGIKSTQNINTKELFTGKTESIKDNLNITLNAADAAIYRFDK